MGLANSACQAVFVGSHCDWKFGAEHILESFSMSSSPQLTPQMPGKERWYQSYRQGNTQHPPIRAPSMKNSYDRFSSSQACADGGSTAAWIEQGRNARYKHSIQVLTFPEPWTVIFTWLNSSFVKISTRSVKSFATSRSNNWFRARWDILERWEAPE